MKGNTTQLPIYPHQHSSSSLPSYPPSYHGSAGAEKWGTNTMGTPAVPTYHPDNQKAAFWGATTTTTAAAAGDQHHQYNQHHNPYVHYTPVHKATYSPMESALHELNSWGTKAETMANNIWKNLKIGSSVSGTAWGKVNLTAKAVSEGGFETLYKQTFTTHPGEILKKTFACYLSTSTGPVAGTLYLSNAHVAFCSDRPLFFTTSSGQQSWSYYKVMVPLGKIRSINQVMMRENPSEKYLKMVTIEGHDFWFMGFVNYEKASRYLSESLSKFIVNGIAVQPNRV